VSNAVGKAVVEALGALGGAASVGAVHRAVETELAGPVARSSVRSYLQQRRPWLERQSVAPARRAVAIANAADPVRPVDRLSAPLRSCG
jgi:hypothetical protein